MYSKIKMSKITNSLRQLAINIAYSEIKPNFYYDKEKTEELKKETLKKYSTGYDKKKIKQ